jgi:hypothetical protein
MVTLFSVSRKLNALKNDNHLYRYTSEKGTETYKISYVVEKSRTKGYQHSTREDQHLGNTKYTNLVKY